MVVTGHFCWPCPGTVGGACATWGTAVGMACVRPCGKMRSRQPVVNFFVGLLSVVDGGGGPGRHGGWCSNHVFSGPSLRGYSHILLDCFDF